jgi:uncharacterized membrane protein YgdD (TMEM256/DUF423 family)
MSAIFFGFWGAVFGGLAVLLGAFGAHALKASLDAYSQGIWEKAVFYQAIHALALLILPTLSTHMGSKSLALTGGLFIAGIILFSGSLYLLAFTAKKYLGAITPIGGVAFIAAWTVLSLSMLKAALSA